MDIVCGSCGGENLVRDTEAESNNDIPLVCRDCGWHGRRTPGVSCRRCGSANVDGTPIDGWSFDDVEDARDHRSTAEWGYVEKTVYRCRICHNEWTVAGKYKPYATADGPGAGNAQRLESFSRRSAAPPGRLPQEDLEHIRDLIAQLRRMRDGTADDLYRHYFGAISSLRHILRMNGKDSEPG